MGAGGAGARAPWGGRGAAADSAAAASSSIVVAGLDALIQRGYARLGSSVDPKRTDKFAEQLTPAGWIDLTGTNHFTKQLTPVPGGFYRTNALGAMRVFRSTDNANISRLLTVDEVTPFWLSFGFRCNSPGAGNNWNMFGLGDPAGGGGFGVIVGLYSPGPGGLSKFAGYTFNGVVEDDVVSTVGVDGSKHGAEVWMETTTGVARYWISIDQEAPIQIPHTHLFTGTTVAPCWFVNNSASGTGDVFHVAGIWPTGFTP